MWTDVATTLGLIVVAELGDKSQLVCLALAGRVGAAWVVAGAFIAFSLLNLLAVLVGGTTAAWIPAEVVQGLAALAFLAFGIHTLRAGDDDDDDDIEVQVPTHPLLTTISLLALAELGDKTQLTVATLSAVQSLWGTWLGATLALTFTSALAAWAGAWILPHLPRRWIGRSAGVLFLIVAAWLLYGLL